MNESLGGYKDVRSLSRGLAVLQALNREPGGVASTTRLSEACGLHRTTTKRLLETLRVDGFVRKGEKEGQYCLTLATRSLSEGLVEAAWIEKVAQPMMRAAVGDLLWPCDLATLDAGFMIIRESTHRFSRLSQHRGMIGERMPIFFTAIGKAYISFCPEEELEGILLLLSKREDEVGKMARNPALIELIINLVQEQGYAVSEGEWEKQSSYGAIAVPLFSGDKLMGAMNMIFPRSAVSQWDINTRYLPVLKNLSHRIGKDMRPWLD